MLSFLSFPEFMHDPADLPVKSCFTESASIAIDTIIKTGIIKCHMIIKVY